MATQASQAHPVQVTRPGGEADPVYPFPVSSWIRPPGPPTPPSIKTLPREDGLALPGPSAPHEQPGPCPTRTPHPSEYQDTPWRGQAGPPWPTCPSQTAWTLPHQAPPPLRVSRRSPERTGWPSLAHLPHQASPKTEQQHDVGHGHRPPSGGPGSMSGPPAPSPGPPSGQWPQRRDPPRPPGEPRGHRRRAACVEAEHGPSPSAPASATPSHQLHPGCWRRGAGLRGPPCPGAPAASASHGARTSMAPAEPGSAPKAAPVARSSPTSADGLWPQYPPLAD